MLKKISVVVCTRNGGKNIAQCIDSLNSQSLDKDLFEVIVVNDGSTDNTQETLDKTDFHIISNPENVGLAKSRNIGVSAAKTELVAFTDDDCMVNEDWLSIILEQFRLNPKLLGLSGKVIPYETDSLVQKYIKLTNPLSALPFSLSKSTSPLYRLSLYLKNQFAGNRELKNKIKLLSVVGANMAFRKKILDEIGGFDEKFSFGGEEEELSYRLLKKVNPGQFQIVYLNNLVVRHKFDRSFTKSLKRNFMYGLGNARLKKKYPERSISVLPFPVFISFIILLGIFFFQAQSIWLFFLPFIFYPAWIIKTIEKKDLELLTFPYIQFFMELSTDLGWANEYSK